MQYMLLIYENDVTAYADGEAGKAWQEIVEAHGRFAGDLVQAGVMRGGNGLKRADTATTVRRTAGAHTVHDGPYAETREQLGGYYLIDVPDLDQALAWARRLPLTGDGAVEVRPVLGSDEAPAEAEREAAHGA
ncbi:MAG TPA: YciI family protein [Caulobacteraceae bacterium]|nr:YciI family protein [Caulobacteraceae bacterium]